LYLHAVSAAGPSCQKAPPRLFLKTFGTRACILVVLCRDVPADLIFLPNRHRPAPKCLSVTLRNFGEVGHNPNSLYVGPRSTRYWVFHEILFDSNADLGDTSGHPSNSDLIGAQPAKLCSGGPFAALIYIAALWIAYRKSLETRNSIVKILSRFERLFPCSFFMDSFE
jgi:hypothetical protein